jgi:putative oxidoreductase
MERIFMHSLLRLYYRFSLPSLNALQSAFLLFVRLYWGWQFAQSGWGKLHHLDKVTEYFQSINVPMAAVNARFVSSLELVGGVLLFAGLFSRLISIPLTINMFVAYYLGDHDAFFSFFKDPGTFYAAAPYTFWLASIIVLVFGPGLFSLDYFIHRALARNREPSPSTARLIRHGGTETQRQT